MRILLFYQYFGTPKGSWSTRIYELSMRWVNEGHKVTVVTSPYEKSDIKSSGFISHQEIDGIKLIVINSADSNKNSFIVRVMKAILFSLVSVWYSLTSKYDICLASSGPITIGLPMILAKKIRNKKTVFEVRDLWPAGAIELNLLKSGFQKKLALWFEKSCYKNADLIVTASIGQKRHIASRTLNKRIEVVPNASDLDLFGGNVTGQLPSWTTDKILLTHIGSLGLIHNIDYWMNIAEEISKIDVKKQVLMVFIGDGADKERLLQHKEKMNLTNILFLGLKPKIELPIWVQNSHATLFATLDNPVQSTCSPNKIFDSFAASRPIIQTTKGWIKDLVDQHNCGINIDLDRPKDAARNIMDFVMDKERVRVAGENAYFLAENEFNRDKLASTYLTYLESIVNE
ncbi:glycosyltransferase family 4 protein [Echinicola rosea]|uniref:Glycosyltransferase WbuB n=1 Tax=Echinicola rosea TaxID=1807691 RepID=A0ABQ1VC32_9BACT|nr:glycosyltransferase family 4 protein [Echinicola rosea]GGF51635.1 glycosyltransferase WbuB [Echinicola rosea]